MAVPRSYQQSCLIAQALDLVGERWTLLIIRELLLGPKRFSELAESLPGLGSNLLADRLRQLENKGLLERPRTAPGAKRKAYSLSPSGLGLEATLRELARWAAQLPPAALGTATFYRPEWDQVALRLLYRPSPAVAGRLLLVTEQGALAVEAAAFGLEFRESDAFAPDATLRSSRAVLKDIVLGHTSSEPLAAQGVLKVEGDAAFAHRWTARFRSS